MKKWASEIKYDHNEYFAKTLDLLKQHGFDVKGYREYVERTDVPIEKDGVQTTMSIHECKFEPSELVKCTENLWELTKKCYRKAE